MTELEPETEVDTDAFADELCDDVLDRPEMIAFLCNCSRRQFAG